MKLLSMLALGATASTSVLALQIPDQKPLGRQNEENDSKKFFIELGPGQTRWVTEEEKWALKRVCTHSNTCYCFSVSF